MEILPDVGRIVCTTVHCVDPIRIATIAMAYRECAAGHIETQLRPDCDWVDNTYKVEGNVIVWNHAGGKEWPWMAIPCDQLPSWFSDMQKKAQKRMDERLAVASENGKAGEEF